MERESITSAVKLLGGLDGAVKTVRFKIQFQNYRVCDINFIISLATWWSAEQLLHKFTI